MTPPNQTHLFVQKADEDIHVLAFLRDDTTTTDAIWGFHAQQATEKLLKSMLNHFGIKFPFTHRLLQLADLLDDNRQPLPVEFDSLMDLTPFAVEYRYSTIPTGPGDSPLNRRDILDLVQRLRSHVASIVNMS